LDLLYKKEVQKSAIKKNSKEELEFLNSITNGVLELNTSNIATEEELENSVWKLASIFQNAWTTYSKLKRIILKNSGIKSALITSADTEPQATFNIGRNSRRVSAQQKESFLIEKYMKLHYRIKGLGT